MGLINRKIRAVYDMVLARISNYKNLRVIISKHVRMVPVLYTVHISPILTPHFSDQCADYGPRFSRMSPTFEKIFKEAVKKNGALLQPKRALLEYDHITFLRISKPQSC